MQYRDWKDHHKHTPAQLNFVIPAAYQYHWTREQARAFIEPHIARIRNNQRYIGVIEDYSTAIWNDEVGYHNNDVVKRTIKRYIDVGFLGNHWFRYHLEEETYYNVFM